MQPKMTADQHLESLPHPADVRVGQPAHQQDQERVTAARNEVKGDLVTSRAETEEQRKREQKRQRLLTVAQVAGAVVLPVLATLARNAWTRMRVRSQARHAHS